MKSIWNFMTSAFESKSILPMVEDPTLYRVETNLRHYCGRIIYQDSMVMKLKIAKAKPVKILKSNIDKITIVQTEMAKEYYSMSKQTLYGTP